MKLTTRNHEFFEVKRLILHGLAKSWTWLSEWTDWLTRLLYILTVVMVMWIYGCSGLVAKSCPTLAALWTVVCQAPLSMGILQARILEWVASSFSRGSSWPKNWTQISCIRGRFFTNWAMREAHVDVYICQKPSHCSLKCTFYLYKLYLNNADF